MHLLAEQLSDEDRVVVLGVPGGKERKTHKMMRYHLEAARKAWLEEAETLEDRQARERTDFLKYRCDSGLLADFHSNRHLFITSLERAGVSPKMAQTLARHGDIRLTFGVYTHVESHDQRAAIAALPPHPLEGDRPGPKPRSFGLRGPRAGQKRLLWCPLWCPRVPKTVPNVPHRSSAERHQIAPKSGASGKKTAILRSP